MDSTIVWFGLATTLGLSSMPASSNTLHFKADLKGANEVPPSDSSGVGTVDATYDNISKKFSWTIVYSRLTDPATAAEFDGPAGAKAVAPSVITLRGGLESPIQGDSSLTDPEALNLQTGRWYLNIYSAKYPAGEIRGQLNEEFDNK